MDDCCERDLMRTLSNFPPGGSAGWWKSRLMAFRRAGLAHQHGQPIGKSRISQDGGSADPVPGALCLYQAMSWVCRKLRIPADIPRRIGPFGKGALSGSGTVVTAPAHTNCPGCPGSPAGSPPLAERLARRFQRRQPGLWRWTSRRTIQAPWAQNSLGRQAASTGAGTARLHSDQSPFG